jgi:hypothetical protein
MGGGISLWVLGRAPQRGVNRGRGWDGLSFCDMFAGQPKRTECALAGKSMALCEGMVFGIEALNDGGSRRVLAG